MMKAIKLCTEGVLVLASAKKLAEEYANKEFDYSFPEGLSNLLERNWIIALTTSDGEDVVLEVNEIGEKLIGDFDKVITQWIELEVDDELLILSHAEFTGICNKVGNYKIYGWPVRKISDLYAGKYKIKIGIEDFRENFTEIEAYFRLTISIAKTEEIEVNHVAEVAL